tara:strand:+ start:239 stop:490 length:252 start_codon:yes stop_codon:yes gene_type:complete
MPEELYNRLKNVSGFCELNGHTYFEHIRIMINNEIRRDILFLGNNGINEPELEKFLDSLEYAETLDNIFEILKKNGIYYTHNC